MWNYFYVYFIWPNISKVLLFQHVTNMKLIVSEILQWIKFCASIHPFPSFVHWEGAEATIFLWQSVHPALRSGFCNTVSTKRSQSSWMKRLVTDLRQGEYKVSLEHLIPESKEVLKGRGDPWKGLRSHLERVPIGLNKGSSSINWNYSKELQHTEWNKNSVVHAWRMGAKLFLRVEYQWICVKKGEVIW